MYGFYIQWSKIVQHATTSNKGNQRPKHLQNCDEKLDMGKHLARSTLHMCQIQFKWSKIHTLTLCMMCRRCSIVRCFLIEAADFTNLFQSRQNPHGVGFQLLYALCQPSGFLGFTILSATRKKNNETKIKKLLTCMQSPFTQFFWKLVLKRFFV